MTPTSLALEALHQRHRNLWQMEKNSLPLASFDAPWPSPCAQEQEQNSGQISYTWQARSRHAVDLFAPLERSLECTFHPDIKTFYGSFWADSLAIEHPQIDALLLQLWNEDDEQHLLENMLGHAFARLKGKLPLSYFIGLTKGDAMVCMEHDSGRIVLEKPGYKAHQLLADNLESFLVACSPCFDEYR